MTYWTVRDVMTTQVVAVAPETSYQEVAQAMTEGRISGVPVIDRTGRVVGVVSEADLLRKPAAPTAGELMTTPAIMVGAEVSVAAATRIIGSRNVRRLPVVDATGRLVGIVSRRNLLRRPTRPDADIRRDIIDDVLVTALWINPDPIAVQVSDGVVTLGGLTPRRSVARRIAELSHEVAGVVEVVDRLRWEYDDSELVLS